MCEYSCGLLQDQDVHAGDDAGPHHRSPRDGAHPLLRPVQEPAQGLQGRCQPWYVIPLYMTDYIVVFDVLSGAIYKLNHTLKFVRPFVDVEVMWVTNNLATFLGRVRQIRESPQSSGSIKLILRG